MTSEDIKHQFIIITKALAKHRLPGLHVCDSRQVRLCAGNLVQGLLSQPLRRLDGRWVFENDVKECIFLLQTASLLPVRLKAGIVWRGVQTKLQHVLEDNFSTKRQLGGRGVLLGHA